MTKYLLRRVLHGLVSIVIVVGIVMVLIYSLMDRQLIFAMDPVYQQQGNNQKTTYRYRRWEEFGYIDYVPYTEWMQGLLQKGEIDQETLDGAVSLGRKAKNDSEATQEWVAKFTQDMEGKGYTVIRLDAVMANKKKVASGGQQQLFAYKDKPLTSRLVNYVTGLITVDNIHWVKEDVGERKLTFTARDPVYGGRFSPAIIGNGTQYKYLLYFDNQFPGSTRTW